MKFYTLKEVAKITRQSNRTIYRHMDKGLIKGVKIGGTWRFEEKELNKYLKGE